MQCQSNVVHFNNQTHNHSKDVSFGSSLIKELFVDGNLSRVVKGIYGGILTIANVTIEHIVPKSKGGDKSLGNIALATSEKNQKRGNKNISEFLDEDTYREYKEQFKGVKVGDFDGDKYIDDLDVYVEIAKEL